jgi:hypothetical protein
MRTKFIAAFVAAVLVAATAPVMTVTNGQPDGNRHPYVGLAIQFDAVNPNLITVCSGAALSATVFLTASHCFDPARPVFVTYKTAPTFTFPTDFTQGTFHPNPEWCFGCAPGLPRADTHDVAVITLNAPSDPGAFASLPTAGLVDTLAMKTPVDIVGYGTEGFARGGGPPQPIVTLTRRFAPSELIQSNSRTSAEFIRLSANPGRGKGGSCFGDSGGPDVLGGTDIVLAVNSYGTNGNCAGGSYSNRVDLPDILAFIMRFLG